MGNYCSLKGVTGECPNIIRVLTDSGSVIEFKGPKLVIDVVNEYPGYGIFRQGHASSPLFGHEYLLGGQFYYLLPLHKVPMLCDTGVTTSQVHNMGLVTEKQDMRWINEIEVPKMSSSAATDFVEELANGPALEVLPTQGNGVWRAKLVINTQQLEEILAEQVNTEALIEKIRMAASSANFTPRRSKSSWKPVLCNAFKVPL